VLFSAGFAVFVNELRRLLSAEVVSAKLLCPSGWFKTTSSKITTTILWVRVDVWYFLHRLSLHVWCAEDSYRKQVTVDDQTCLLDIVDNAGQVRRHARMQLGMVLSRADSLLCHAQGEFSDVRDHYLRAGQGFMIVYSVTSPSSFHEVSQFRDQILRVKGADSVPIVIVANKARTPRCPALWAARIVTWPWHICCAARGSQCGTRWLIFLQCDLENAREVSAADGRDLANSFGAPFFESSAKSSINVEEAFHELVCVSVFDLSQQLLSCSRIHIIYRYYRSEKPSALFLDRNPVQKKNRRQIGHTWPPAAASCSSSASATHCAPHDTLSVTLQSVLAPKYARQTTERKGVTKMGDGDAHIPHYSIAVLPPLCTLHLSSSWPTLVIAIMRCGWMQNTDVDALYTFCDACRSKSKSKSL